MLKWYVVVLTNYYNINLILLLFFRETWIIDFISISIDSQARFVILQVLNQAGDNFVSVKEVIGEDGKPDLLFSMDRSKLGNYIFDINHENLVFSEQ